MGREAEDHEVAGIKYTITQYPLKKSTRIFNKLMKVLVEPAGKAIEAVGGIKGGEKSFLDKEIDTKLIAEAISILSEKMDGDDLYDLLKEICSCAIAEGNEEMKVPGGKLVENFDAHFQSRMGAMFKLTTKCIEVNYKDFLEELLGQVGLVRG